MIYFMSTVRTVASGVSYHKESLSFNKEYFLLHDLNVHEINKPSNVRE